MSLLDPTAHTVHLADSRAMPELADQSVHLVVTSPPYWQLKDYGAKNQIGFHNDYREYINNLNLVWEECNRVLHPGCRLCVNIGDQFARAAHYGRYKVIPIRAEIIRFCECLGLDYMGGIIWQKVTTCNTSGGASIMGSFPFPRNGIVKIDYEFILIFKKPGQAPPPSEEAKEAARMTTEDWNTYFYGHWNFPGERQTEHIAAFPVELPHRLIRMFTFPGETVLDPFLGSGTTSLAAQRLGRRSVGYEINPELREVIERKVGGAGDLLDAAAPVPIEFIERTEPPADLEARIERLQAAGGEAGPVIVRQVDSRKATYGSRVTMAAPPKTPKVRVAEVLAPHRLRLTDGREVRLLGLAPFPGEEPDAVARACAHLRAMLGRSALMLFDGAGPVGQRTADAVYVYLSNQKFVNARMIREGFARADREQSHRMLHRFVGYEQEAQTARLGLWAD